MKCAIRALAHAVETKVAFGFAPAGARNGIVAALAMEQASVAIAAVRGILFEAQNGPAGYKSQQRSQRAQGAAPEARDAQVEYENRCKNQSQEEAFAEERLFETEQDLLRREIKDAADCLDDPARCMTQHIEEGIEGIIEPGEYRKRKGAYSESNRIHHNEQASAKERGDQQRGQDVVLERLPGLVAIRIEECMAPLACGFEIAEEVIQSSQRTDPAAEEAAEKKSGNQNNEAPQQPAIQGVSRQGIRDGGQRVKLQKDLDGIGKTDIPLNGLGRTAEFRLEEQKKKENEENNLGDTPDSGQLRFRHLHPPRGSRRQQRTPACPHLDV